MSQAVQQLIVVIDDEQALLDLYETSLGRLGHVQTFSSPEKFIQKMSSDPGFRPDLIITDYQMPGMNGVKVVQTIHDPAAPIATILLSGYLDKEKSIAAVNAGVSHILEKPVVRNDLITLAKELLLNARHKQVQAEIAEVMQQLKEMFLTFRMLCLNELEIKAMQQPLLFSVDSGPGAEAESLEQSLQHLEDQLQTLIGAQGELRSELERATAAKRAS